MSTKIDGILFQSMVIEGALSIEDQKQKANDLNVFPVPDGDTGTNMSLTMFGALNEISKLEHPSLQKAAEVTASSLLRGARGNSGVILSLLFRGIAKKLKSLACADGADFAVALKEGVDTAYKAVMKPAEGTMLTVSRVAAQHAVELCQANPELSVEEVLDAILEKGGEALKETQFQNPVLEKAGVVDAGGFGFLTILEGMRNGFLGIRPQHNAPAPEEDPSADFSALSDEDITYTYCTEFIAERVDKSRNVDRVRQLLSDIGDSLVLVEDDDIVKVHVHTDQPNLAIAEGLKFGPLVTVKIENMRQQHSAKVIESQAPRASSPEAPAERVVVPPEKKYGFVAVAAGDGITSLFRELGVDCVVQGGQTMNPSTNDILCAVDAVPAEIVFVLPNNKNIIMAAEQAVPLSEKKILVIPTKTIPQGVAALLAFDPDGPEAANTTGMLDCLSSVKTGQITYAARNSDFDGKKIKEGEYLSLLEGKLCSNSKKLAEVVKRLAKDMTRDGGSFLTIYYGAGMTEEDAAAVQATFAKYCDDLEVTLIDGGQPVYYFLISLEQ